MFSFIKNQFLPCWGYYFSPIENTWSLRWGDYSGLSGPAQCNQEGRRQGRCAEGSRGQSAAGPLGKEAGRPPELEKARSEGTQLCPHLDFSSQTLLLDF